MLSLLLPALSAVRGRMKMLKCATNLRTVAFKFQLFAEGETTDGRGDSDEWGRRSFFINDFQESLYRIDEFWELEGESVATLVAKKEAMLCPAGAPKLTRRSGFPCSSAAVGPAEDITLAANMRLYRGVVEFMGHRVLAPAAATHVRQDVLAHPYVPLVMDVDGAQAVQRGVEPFYIAPPFDVSTDPTRTDATGCPPNATPIARTWPLQVATS